MFSKLESTERPKSRMQLPRPRINKHQETAEFQRSDSNLEGLLAELHATFSGSSELSVGECGLVLDIESCDRCAGCPGCGVNRSRSRARGGGGDRRALGRGPGKVPVAQYGAGYAANAPARR